MSSNKANLSLKDYNTFGLDVSAKCIVKLSQVSELNTIANLRDCLFIGGGSNLLLTRDLENTVVINETRGIRRVTESDHFIELAVASGENWHDFVLYCISNGYGGVENMSLIPGSVGAAPMQNIGAYGSEIKDVLTYVEAIDLVTKNTVRFTNEECKFGYRESIFKKEAKANYFISEVGIKLSKTNHQLNTRYGDIAQWLSDQNISQPTLKNVSDAVISIRESKLPDPKVLGNSGSFFKNPIISLEHYNSLQGEYPEIKSYPVSESTVKVPAGWLIESLGWKGKRVGSTGSHAKQSLVLVNYGNANGQEVYELAIAIQKSVWDTYRIRLELEVNIV